MSTAIRQSAASFRREREGDWQAFEALLTRLERRRPRSLSDEELIALPVLYRATLSALSVARATSLDRAMIAYLEALSLRGYLALYGQKAGLGGRALAFIRHDWPAAVRELWRELAVSIVLLVVGALAGYQLVAHDPSWFDPIVGQMAEGRGPHASAAALRAILYDQSGRGNLSIFATWLFTHNAQVSLFAFALGFAFGVPTVLLVLNNGALIGAMLQVYIAKGLGWQLGGWLAIHGTTELFAIAIAGAAGLRIGTRIAFPGELSRVQAAVAAGRTTAAAMVGVVIMLVVAGLLEGIGRQTITSDGVRFAIGGAMLLLWSAYYALAGRRHGPA